MTEVFIEPHEEAALDALSMTLLTGSGGFVALFFQVDVARPRRLNWAIAILAAFAVVSLVWTANLGGHVRNTEIRAAGDPTAGVSWLFKKSLAAKTLGETAGDAVSMSMNLGHLIGLRSSR